MDRARRASISQRTISGRLRRKVAYDDIAKTALTLAIGLVTFSVLPGAAQTADATTSTAPPLQRGSTVNNAAKANQRAPSDARDLSPDNKQSAAGGPSGGTGRGGVSGGN